MKRLTVELIPDLEQGGFTAQGFRVVRVRGSHHVLARGNTHTTVPVHGNQTLRIGTLRAFATSK